VEVSLEWLRDFVDLPPLSQLSEHLRNAGIEVEAVHDPRTMARGVVLGRVLECIAHPHSEKLTLCRVSDGKQNVSVVCGASNVAEGQFVAFASLGAQVGALNIAKREVRGISSEGMLCSRQELGLAARSAGIWVIDGAKEDALGQDVFEVTGILPVLSLGITPNRPDLLSHIGVAREIAAATKQRMRTPNWRVSERGLDAATFARVSIENMEDCSRYHGRIIRNVKVGPSPAWLSERLERIGQRPINNIVDVTNYILMETGQPLHAFDLDMIEKNDGMAAVEVRRARQGETLVCLDGEERQLQNDQLVIADPSGPIALAGVIGGLATEVSESTKDVFLESAYFEPTLVRRASKRHDLHTESAKRFERGADPGMALRASDRCAKILEDISGGQVIKGRAEASSRQQTGEELTLRLTQITRILGVEVSADRIVEFLEPLEIRCIRRNDLVLHFEIPSYRPDIRREADLIEEVARRYGYNNIPISLPHRTGDDQIPDEHGGVLQARQVLLACGFSEVITYGFGSPSQFAGASEHQDDLVRILNPLGEELSCMRTSLLPGLFSVLHRNVRHGQSHVRLFEIGRTYHKNNTIPSDDERDSRLPREQLRLAFVMAGERTQGLWYGADKAVDFFDLSGVLENIVEMWDLCEPYHLEPCELKTMVSGGAAKVWIGEQCVGTIGQIHPRELRQRDLQGPLLAAEIDLACINNTEMQVLAHRTLSKFPIVTRDVTLLVGKEKSASGIIDFMRHRGGGELGPGVLSEVRLVGEYVGRPIPKDSRSLTFTLSYRHPDRTLRDTEVSEAFEALLVALREDLLVGIR
jgi:phenylalanyl-tRNA synthetase beta chain